MKSVLARAVLLLPAAMALWWFVLKRASLWLLFKLAYVPLGLMVAPGGLPPVRVDPATREWTFNVAVGTSALNRQTGERQFVESTEFVVDEDSVAFFSSGWFAYLALAAAAGALTRPQVRQVLKGLAIETAVSVLSLAAFAYINGYGSVVQSPGSVSLYMWSLKYVYHLIYLVVPFAGPFAIAVLLHPRWRAAIGLPDPAPRAERRVKLRLPRRAARAR